MIYCFRECSVVYDKCIEHTFLDSYNDFKVIIIGWYLDFSFLWLNDENTSMRTLLWEHLDGVDPTEKPGDTI